MLGDFFRQKLIKGWERVLSSKEKNKDLRIKNRP